MTERRTLRLACVTSSAYRFRRDTIEIHCDSSRQRGRVPTPWNGRQTWLTMRSCPLPRAAAADAGRGCRRETNVSHVAAPGNAARSQPRLVAAPRRARIIAACVVVVVLRSPVRTRTTAGAPEAPGDEATGGGRRHRRRWFSAGRRRGSGADGPAPLLGPSHRGSVPDLPHRDSRAPRGAGLARPRARGRRRLTGCHAAGAARCAWDCYSPSSVIIASGDLTCMEGIMCIAW